MRMNSRILLLFVFCFAVSLHAQQPEGDVEWSWQTPEDFFEGADASGEDIPLEEPLAEPIDVMEPLVEPVGDAAVAEQPPPRDESWMWEEEVEADFAPPSTVTPAGPPAKKGAAIDVSAYDELLKENLDLRREADRAREAQEAIAVDNRRLRQEMQDLELRLQQLAVTLQEAKKSAPAANAAAVDKTLELEKQLAEARGANDKLEQQVATLQQALAAKPAGASPAPGSDLYRELEAQNAQLKEKLSLTQEELRDTRAKLGEIDTADDKQEAELRRAWETRDELRKQIAQAEDEEKKHRRVVEKLLSEIPRLEEQLAKMSRKVEEKDAALAARDREFQAMKLELERREHRLVQAEKMTDVLDEARRDIGEVSKRQQRDMHYNMALVYAKEGRFREAEREYLRALRLDPTDAESHYNLGILYDDEFNDKRRAAMHYRRYLKLNPSGQDADAVKGWLMRIEMQGD